MGNVEESGHLAGEMQWMAEIEGAGGEREEERGRATNVVGLRSKTMVICGLLVMLCGRKVQWLWRGKTKGKITNRFPSIFIIPGIKLVTATILLRGLGIILRQWCTKQTPSQSYSLSLSLSLSHSLTHTHTPPSSSSSSSLSLSLFQPSNFG